MRLIYSCLIFLTLLAARAEAVEVIFDTPSDDRWHYPFNFTPGNRGIGSTFGAIFEGFNDRDGALILAWDTSTEIDPNLGPDAYDIDSIRITLTNQANMFVGPDWPVDLTVDEWFTFDIDGDGFVNADGIARGEPGDVDGESDDGDPGRPMELFGAAFDPGAPFDESSWDETSIYIGGADAGNTPRNPFPFVFKETTFEKLHVEDNIKGLHNELLNVFEFTPVPWAVGEPIGYTPGSQNVPFDIVFDVDLTQSSGEVKRYFQEQLDRGRIIVIVTSLREADVMGPQSGFPSLYLKEGLFDVGSKAPALTIMVNACGATGDVNGDLTVDLNDVTTFVEVVLGIDTDPGNLQRADLNCDGVVDGRDIEPLLASIL
ncbi:MAG: dockerin type I domain-containing protein [Phycisphaerales bacterium]|nr:dockerin type I domain-containing protein [Phycisphaerales bacterium]